MKNHIIQLLLTASLALPAFSHAQTVADNCNAVNNAAMTGRNQANNRIKSIEQAIRDAASRQRTCMERFGDLASKQAIVIGGFDMGPLRNLLTDNACSIIESKLNSTINSNPLLNGVISQVGQAGTISSGGLLNSTIPMGQTAPGASVPINAERAKSVWDRASSLFN